MADETSSNGLIVGATRKPDGTWDMSHAATMTGEWKISDPIVDRLRGPLQVDSEKESRYQSFQAIAQHEAEQGNLADWFVRLMNQIKPDDLPNITPDDVASLQFVTNAPEVQALQQQFGHDYNRPYFQLDLADYQKVYKKLTGHLGSNGCTIKGGVLDQIDATKGMALIIAPSLGPDIKHEIIHSIDPNESKRSPSDEVIEEFGPYYEEVYHPRIYTQTTVQTDEHGHKSAPQITSREVYETIPRICQTLKDDLYANKYAENFPSRESYLARVDEIGNVLKQLGEHMKPQEIHKIILNAKSFYELSHLLDVIKREKS